MYSANVKLEKSLISAIQDHKDASPSVLEY